MGLRARFARTLAFLAPDKPPGPARAGLAAALALLLLAAIAPGPAGAAAQEAPARLFAAHALALRAAGVEGGAAAAEALAAMPGASAAGAGESLSALWRPFFTNAIVKLGRLRSPAPAALYYNPLLDLAVFTLWEKREEGYRVASIRALPGERLADPGAAAPLRPQWTAAKRGPAIALARTAAARLDAFRRAHPADAGGAGRDAVSFAAAAADLRAALPRLVWNMAMRALWADERFGWLGPALGRIAEALAARDAAAVRAAAPDTDAATAGALARLPAAFAAGLALDMTLEAGGNDRLIVASPPGDGHIYALALCRLDGGACRLRRLLLMPLVE